MDQAAWEASVTWVGVVAGCLLTKDEKFLLVQEKQPKAYGKWNLPAGHVDRGEAIEAAAIRETQEEAGYQVKLIKEVGLYHESAQKPVVHIFSADIIGDELHFPSDELLDAKWLTFEEIKRLHEAGQLRALWIWELIRQIHTSVNP